MRATPVGMALGVTRMTIGRMAVGHAHLGSAEIGLLTVHRLKVVDAESRH